MNRNYNRNIENDKCTATEFGKFDLLSWNIGEYKGSAQTNIIGDPNPKRKREGMISLQNLSKSELKPNLMLFETAMPITSTTANTPLYTSANFAHIAGVLSYKIKPEQLIYAFRQLQTSVGETVAGMILFRFFAGSNWRLLWESKGLASRSSTAPASALATASRFASASASASPSPPTPPGPKLSTLVSIDVDHGYSKIEVTTDKEATVVDFERLRKQVLKEVRSNLQYV